MYMGERACPWLGSIRFWERVIHDMLLCAWNLRYIADYLRQIVKYTQCFIAVLGYLFTGLRFGHSDGGFADTLGAGRAVASRIHPNDIGPVGSPYLIRRNALKPQVQIILPIQKGHVRDLSLYNRAKEIFEPEDG